MKKEKKAKPYVDPYFEEMHKKGIILTIISLVLFVGVPTVTCIVYDIMPNFGTVIATGIGLIAIFVPTGIAEMFGEVPIMGSSYYLACLTGNILNLKLPSAINAIKVSGFKQSRATETSIRLTWKKVKKADGYQVYRYNKSTKKYQKVATVKTNTYTDKKLKTATVYQYKVRAYRKSGKKTVTGKYSNVIKAATSPQKVTAVKAKRVKSKVKLTWKKVKGADGYEIYRATSKKGKYQKIKTLKKGTIVSYTDGKAKKGKTYYYKVRAVKNAGKTSVKGTASNAVRCGK